MSNLPTDKIISCFYGTSEDCVKVLSPEGLVMSFNPGGLKLMEVDDERDVIGRDWLYLWRGNMHSKATNAVAKAKKGHAAHFEGYCPTFKGTMKYWDVNIVPLRDNFDEVTWLLVTSRDLTGHKELEQEVETLRQENDELRARLDTIAIRVLSHAPEGESHGAIR